MWQSISLLHAEHTIFWTFKNNTPSSLVRLGKTERKLKMKKLFKWLFVKEKQETEYFFEPVWTPYEENERKYEARQKREQELLAKYGNR